VEVQPGMPSASTTCGHPENRFRLETVPAVPVLSNSLSLCLSFGRRAL
jgi:hypothetical protein